MVSANRFYSREPRFHRLCSHTRFYISETENTAITGYGKPDLTPEIEAQTGYAKPAANPQCNSAAQTGQKPGRNRAEIRQKNQLCRSKFRISAIFLSEAISLSETILLSAAILLSQTAPTMTWINGLQITGASAQITSDIKIIFSPPAFFFAEFI